MSVPNYCFIFCQLSVKIFCKMSVPNLCFIRPIKSSTIVEVRIKCIYIYIHTLKQILILNYIAKIFTCKMGASEGQTIRFAGDAGFYPDDIVVYFSKYCILQFSYIFVMVTVLEHSDPMVS